MQGQHSRSKHFKKLPSVDSHSISLIPSKPQESRQNRYARHRTLSVSYTPSDSIVRNIEAATIQPSNPQLLHSSSHLIPRRMNSLGNTANLQFKTYQRQVSFENAQEIAHEPNSELTVARRNTKQETNKIVVQKSLNELEFDPNSDDDDEGSTTLATKPSIKNPSVPSTVLQKFKPMISILPKSLGIPDSLKNSWYAEYTQNKRYNFYWHTKKSNELDTGPTGREGATLTIVGSKAYVYGGRAVGILRELYVYDLNKDRWKIPPVTGEVPRHGRAGHSAVAIKSSIWIFGGETEMPANRMSRVCLNSIIVFNTILKQWNSIQARSLRETILPRRNHAGCVYDQVIVVYGGIGQASEYFNDFWVFNTDSKIWKRIDIKEDRHDDEGIAYHTMCSVFQGKEAFLNQNQRRKVAMEGFYVFGGRNQKGETLGKLKLLRYDKGGMSWTYPSTKGVAPMARYGHSMVYNPEGGYLVLHGGRNDKLFQTQKTCCLNDLNVLDLSYLSWCTVSTFGDLYTEARYMHTASIYMSQMVIFGGLHDYHFIDSGIRRLELDQEEVKKLQAIDIKNADLKRVSLSFQFTQLLEKVVKKQEVEADLQEEKKKRKKPKTITSTEPFVKTKSTIY